MEWGTHVGHPWEGWSAAIFADDLLYLSTHTKWRLLFWTPHESLLPMGELDFTPLRLQGKQPQHPAMYRRSWHLLWGTPFFSLLKRGVVNYWLKVNFLGAVCSVVEFFFFLDFVSIYQTPLTRQTLARLFNIFISLNTATPVGILNDSNGNYSPCFLNTGCHLFRVTWLKKGRGES